jgi:class 3 adenylate cyclase/tetratricopeptide (TPR) repeat protein
VGDGNIATPGTRNVGRRHAGSVAHTAAGKPRTFRVMAPCPTCGTENIAGSRFCNTCGAALSAAPPAPDERKVVSALFCDLVGFTATSESADPEDVDRMLTAYFAMARSQIEAHGGVVEKFIGDAVLGVFGVPAAHEDDPERAVRAALRICEDAAGLRTVGGTPLRLRVGVNTGEVLVRLGVAPGSGERFLAGDTINTASRIQSVAPELGVAVGRSTYDATKAVFRYEELPPAVLKGKAAPVRIFRPTASRARLGVDLSRTHGSAYVGREIDLALLKGLFDKSVAASSVQLVTVVGEPGIGKSRIVAELLAHAQARAPGLTWRQGRCLPYGDGVTFWALGEIVKAHAGILESDDPTVAGAKIDDAVPAGPDRDWLRQRLRPLVGVDTASGAEREELFAAWRTFLEEVAEAHPTVLVFEDIHWADDAMLAFLEHLADRAAGVPLLVVATARPELFERDATFGAGLPNVIRINIAPLSDAETGQLVASLLGAVVPPELQVPILERAEGNPLYAEEFVRLLRDRDLLVEDSGSVTLRQGHDLPLPDSIGALITARLDTLPAERKAMLADAAVVGKVFWAGAVAAMGGRDVAAVTDAMHELARKELVRPARHSSMAGEAEYAFWHVLTRDVAYAQLPRPSRAARHVAAAQWLEAKAGDRAEDVAEVLAHHWATALDLARAAGQDERAVSLEPKALRYLTLAGDKATQLDMAAAVASFERALALTPPGHPVRPRLLVKVAEAMGDSGRTREAVELAQEAVETLRAQGDLVATLDAMGVLEECYRMLADARRWVVAAERLAIAETLQPGDEVVRAIVGAAQAESWAGRHEAAVELLDRALEMDGSVGGGHELRLLANRGWTRGLRWDAGGLDDIRRAIALAIESGNGSFAANWYNNLAALQIPFEGPAPALDTLRTAMALARARGLEAATDTIIGSTINVLWDLGALDEALDLVRELERRSTADRSVLSRAEGWSYEALVLVLQGRANLIEDRLEWIATTMRASGSAEYGVVGLGACAIAWAALGQPDAAAALLVEIAASPGMRRQMTYAIYLPPLVRAALSVGAGAVARRLVEGVEPAYPFAAHALVTTRAAFAETDGELATAAAAYSDAASRWASFGIPYEQALALLGAGRCLIGLGRSAEAAPSLRGARELFARLDAGPALAQADALLQQPTSLAAG